ncbi:PREDICTED: olfactory receptor 11L1-like [Nanorana parkeri]|uniref:olfactory receptor 11L1-like n=1 Tax=Nanorana parkeri TaxID=125878 RepID=UPI0008547261|nr:PREDICTED: olfactory receptor 11L1-like [Nanorana parkeri]
MTKDNHTMVTEFILLGFTELHNIKSLLLSLLLLIYVGTILGNLLIVTLVAITRQLWSPMYFFLSHLSLCDILISTNVVPKTLQFLVTERCHISVSSCYTQLYFFGAFVATECSLLSVMSYDRYLAICDPLHYSSTMKRSLPRYLATICWLVGFFTSMIIEILITLLDFCGPNIIDHFFCDLTLLLELSCSDTKLVDICTTITVFIIGISQLLFVIVSYICIFTSILRISSITGRQKIFSTCSSHLAVVSTYYGTLIVLYVAPTRGQLKTLNKVLSLLNTVITPLFNPIIYSLRNKEIKLALSKIILKMSPIKGN